MDGSAEISELARHLATLTESATGLGARLSEREWREPYAPGKWTRLEVLGHLLDSAAHNHQRFARALHEESIMAPGYDGGAQVRAQHYAKAPIHVLVDAWRAQNRLLSFVLEQIPASKERTPCSIGSAAPMTLRELAFDYVAHLEHHLKQIFAGRDGLEYSGLPWPPEGRWR
jgi:DinB superfamily